MPSVGFMGLLVVYVCPHGWLGVFGLDPFFVASGLPHPTEYISKGSVISVLIRESKVAEVRSSIA